MIIMDFGGFVVEDSNKTRHAVMERKRKCDRIKRERELLVSAYGSCIFMGLFMAGMMLHFFLSSGY